ncbi:hypothetical protein ACJJTC_014717 [Scirpophaga incertulas]
MRVIRKLLNWYARLAPARGKISPPYEHVVQIGDPTLRKVCEDVNEERIKSSEVQLVVKKLIYVLNKYGSVGMSAPQIGVNMKIFAIQHTAKQLSNVPLEIKKFKRLAVVPLTVCINPSMKILDYQKEIHMEGCESIQGYSAEVPRYREVQITALNEHGEKVTSVFKGWPARIVQHEMDHLGGKLFTDIMERKTLVCTCWEEVNLSKGKVAIPFYPD